MGRAQTKGSTIRMIRVRPGPAEGMISSMPKAPADTRQKSINAMPRALILLLRRLPTVPSGEAGGKKSSLPGGSASLADKLKPPQSLYEKCDKDEV